MSTVESRSRFISGPDGLILHAADHRPTSETRVPVVCLAGLSRNSRDFAALAPVLSAHGHRVIALDYRGRGLSAWDKNPRRYTLDVERADILAVLTALGVGRAAFVGASRGGLHIMALAAARPTLIAAAVLNDVGPMLETQGLLRIKLRLMNRPEPVNWTQAVSLVEDSYRSQFPALHAEDWDFLARATIRETDEHLAWDYDPALSQTLDAVGPDMRPFDLWPQFEALAGVPILAIRGQLSDVLSPSTFATMQIRAGACRGIEIPGQGHTPLLNDSATLSEIRRFLSDIM